MTSGAGSSLAAKAFLSGLVAAGITAMAFGVALAQGAPPATKDAALPTFPRTGIDAVDALKGTWIRPDGGYQIVISSASPDGRLDAMYFNPNPLPFAKAEAVMEGTTLRVSLELRAGGYGGSTYDLAYDPSRDRLVGVYHQAVAKQKFDVYFVRSTAR